MPTYFVNQGMTQEVSEDFFDMLWDSIDDGCSPSTDEDKPAENKNWRRQSNGFYNNKLCDENYFKKYYQDKTKIKCVCDVCGTELSCKSNLAKHKKTKKCRKNVI